MESFLSKNIAKKIISPIKSLQQVTDLTSQEMALVNQSIRAHLNSKVVLINQIAEYIISNGGKRLRPMLVILASKALGYSGNNHINLAAIIELIHTATLLHDDVVDESELRRGNKTSHEIWGNSASVLVGDYLYSKSFQMMVKVDQMDIMSVLSDATNRIAEGEVQQLLNIGRLDITENEYYTVIDHKTAKLFEAACHLAAILTAQNEHNTQALIEYGKNLGIAFQIADDALDYNGSTQLIGKNLGDDLSEGKLTLPLIYMLNHGTQNQKQLIKNAIKKSTPEVLQHISDQIKTSGALDYTLEKAQHFAERAQAALAPLDNNLYKSSLDFLCKIAWQRTN